MSAFYVVNWEKKNIIFMADTRLECEQFIERIGPTYPAYNYIIWVEEQIENCGQLK